MVGEKSTLTGALVSEGAEARTHPVPTGKASVASVSETEQVGEVGNGHIRKCFRIKDFYLISSGNY